MAGRVYKLRKPVRFGVLDFTERKAREQDCHREVALNRRLAPDVYLGVADVAIDGVPVDHIVVTRALPEEWRLTALVRVGRDGWMRVGPIAATLASFMRRNDVRDKAEKQLELAQNACLAACSKLRAARHDAAASADSVRQSVEVLLHDIETAFDAAQGVNSRC